MHSTVWKEICVFSCLILVFSCNASLWYLHSSKNAFIMQSKSTFLEFFDVYSSLQICPPPPKKNSSGAKFIQDEWHNFHRAHALFTGVKFHVLPRVLVCFLVEFDFLFAISVLSCRIVDCASLFIYVHEQDCLCFPMLTVETAVFDRICWLRSSRDSKGQSYPVEYCLESVEEYSEGTIHKGESES